MKNITILIHPDRCYLEYYIKNNLPKETPLSGFNSYFTSLKKTELSFGLSSNGVYHWAKEPTELINNKDNCLDEITKLYTNKRYLIITFAQLDKRSKLYKQFKDSCYFLNGPTDKEIISLLSDLNIPDENKLQLAKDLNYDWGKCYNAQFIINSLCTFNSKDHDFDSISYEISSIASIWSVGQSPRLHNINRFLKFLPPGIMPDRLLSSEQYLPYLLVNCNPQEEINLLANLYNTIECSILKLEGEKLSNWQLQQYEQWVMDSYSVPYLLSVHECVRLTAMAIQQGGNGQLLTETLGMLIAEKDETLFEGFVRTCKAFSC